MAGGTLTPAGLICVDMVRHSRRDLADRDRIQRVLDSAIRFARDFLSLVDAHFKDTGDGYFIVLPGVCSGRTLDFLHVAIPALVEELEPLGQSLRVGVDFGLVHLAPNDVSGTEECFDEPGIRAARLEAAAKPGEILCSEAVHQVFAPRYADSFGTRRMRRTKDRTLAAFPLRTYRRADFRKFVADYLIDHAPIDRRDSVDHADSVRPRALVVEDDKKHSSVPGAVK